jgi:uncharacterized protein (TIGR02594 family)
MMKFIEILSSLLKQFFSFVSKKPEPQMVLDDSKPWFTVAKSYLGQKELTGNNDGQFVADSFKAVGSSLKADKWCAAFIGRCLKEAGYDYVKKGVAALNYAKYGDECELKQGAIIVIRHPNGSHHVTFLDHIVSAKVIACLGGNQKNRVGIDNYDLTKETLIACRWPKSKKVEQIPIENVIPIKLPGELNDFKKGTLNWYRKAFDMCAIDQGYEAAVRSTVKLVLSGKEKYQVVEKATGVPWYVIGAVHFKEASCNWKSVLHNGERIIGTGKKTMLVPKGRGPFETWEEAAIDAMKGESLGKMKSWELGALLLACEKYNGWGYQTGAGKAENSPYLWARSNINDDSGKYVSDGKFDPDATTQKTTGLAVILKELEKSGEIKIPRS